MRCEFLEVFSYREIRLSLAEDLAQDREPNIYNQLAHHYYFHYLFADHILKHFI